MSHLCPRPASTWTESLPQHFDIPLARADHPQKRADGSGFSRAVETDEAVNLALFHAQVDIVHCEYIAILFRQIVCFNCVVHLINHHIFCQVETCNLYYFVPVFQFRNIAKQ